MIFIAIIPENPLKFCKLIRYLKIDRLKHWTKIIQKCYTITLVVWIITNCHDKIGSDFDEPIKGKVNNTFIAGRIVKTMTFEIVAIATIIRFESG